MNMERLNRFFQQAQRWVRCRGIEFRAAISGNRFYCSALSGESSYNVSINCDMTVSCNCQDFDGCGQIGDLRKQHIKEIFGSSQANHLRHQLASGKLPIVTCAACAELHSVPAEYARHRAETWHIPTKGIMVENTISCPYRCKACSRTVVRRIRKSTRMSLSDIEQVSDIIHECNIESLAFFNLGETFAAPDVCEQFRIIREKNPNLSIIVSTNGYLLDTDVKREAALLANHIFFSIDGIDDRTVTKYQRGASFPRSYGNMKDLVQYRNRAGKSVPTIEWKYVIFNWNDSEWMIRQAIEMARKANVDIISFWPTKSPLYGISWRYFVKSFFRNLGKASWKGREVRLV
jgi:pyruvate-formate lyase-activating enzyme